MQTKWLSYYNATQKEYALHTHNGQMAIDYGEIIYTSSPIQNARWLVAKFAEEYNVFVDHIMTPTKFERKFCISFKYKQRALAFALEMFLVCSGKLCRSELRNLTSPKHSSQV